MSSSFLRLKTPVRLSVTDSVSSSRFCSCRTRFAARTSSWLRRSRSTIVLNTRVRWPISPYVVDPQPHAEIGHLTRVFNTMVDRLRRSHDEVRAANRVLQEQNRLLETMSVTDSLTGVFNRKKLDDILADQFARFRRSQRPFAVLMLDIDNFKLLNDSRGHLAGDAVLARLAVILRRSVRSVDFVARYGGEEFVVVLVETSAAAAVPIAERIRAQVEQPQADAADAAGAPIAFTVSLGVSDSRIEDAGPEDALARADRAMYEAKDAGRRRTCARPSAGGHGAPTPDACIQPRAHPGLDLEPAVAPGVRDDLRARGQQRDRRRPCARLAAQVAVALHAQPHGHVERRGRRGACTRGNAAGPTCRDRGQLLRLRRQPHRRAVVPLGYERRRGPSRSSCASASNAARGCAPGPDSAASSAQLPASESVRSRVGLRHKPTRLSLRHRSPAGSSPAAPAPGRGWLGPALAQLRVTTRDLLPQRRARRSRPRRAGRPARRPAPRPAVATTARAAPWRSHPAPCPARRWP